MFYVENKEVSKMAKYSYEPVFEKVLLFRFEKKSQLNSFLLANKQARQLSYREAKSLHGDMFHYWSVEDSYK